MQHDGISPQQYRDWGVAPPSFEPHGTEADVANAMEQNRKIKHKWHQEGARLICTACPWHHATEPLFTNYLLQGTDPQGQPILKKVANTP
jgi:hypothetical protein